MDSRILVGVVSGVLGGLAGGALVLLVRPTPSSALPAPTPSAETDAADPEPAPLAPAPEPDGRIDELLTELREVSARVQELESGAAAEAPTEEHSASDADPADHESELSDIVKEVRLRLGVEQLPEFERVSWDGIVPRLDLPGWEVGLRQTLPELPPDTRRRFLVTLVEAEGEFGLAWSRFKTWMLQAGRDLNRRMESVPAESHAALHQGFQDEKRQRSLNANAVRHRLVAAAMREFLANDLSPTQRERYLRLTVFGDGLTRPWRNDDGQD